VATIRSNVRWCSDILEFTCWSGEVVRVAFALDCHDREVIGWVATTAGISGEMIRDMMVRCVEQRFSDIRAPHPVQWLSDNRSILRRSSDDRDRRGAQSGALLHPGRKPREQRHG
jgi:transposase InsO family protein